MPDGRKPSSALTPTSHTTPDLRTETRLGPAKSDLPPAFQPGQTVVERFHIVRLIGRGGMGEVYEADDTVLQERVALKTLRRDSGTTAVDEERFRREIQLARRVTHVNACRLFDFEVHRDAETGAAVPLLSMEFLPGQTLSEFLREHGRLTPAEAWPLIQQITAGLSAAHKAGIVHRDFKCSNVMLVPGSPGEPMRAVVTDFGLARMATLDEPAHLPTFSGTPAYMSPEQAEGRPASAASDIFALGVVLYEMLTGRLPFRDVSSPSSVARHRSITPPMPVRAFSPDVSPEWEQVILKCLENDPAKRFESADEVARALLPAPGGRGGVHPRRRLVLAAVAGVAIAAASLYVHQRFSDRSPRPRSVAVLGFKNLSGRAETAWLSTAFREMLATELAAGPGLRAVPGERIGEMRADLKLGETDSFPEATLRHIQAYLSADIVLVGSYLALSDDAQTPIRLDVRVQDMRSGAVLASVSDTARQAEMSGLVIRVGSRLRQELGLAVLTPEEATVAAANRPRSRDAARLYAEGLTKLRLFDAAGAKDLLLKAIAMEPDYALSYVALSLAWTELGHDDSATDAAHKAVERAGGLSREQRLLVRARLEESKGDLVKALEAYEVLFALAPDDVEYGLRVAEIQSELERPAAMARTVERLESLGREVARDPRTLLVKARMKELAADAPAALALRRDAREEATRRGQRFYVAKAALKEATSLIHHGQLSAAGQAAAVASDIYRDSGNARLLGVAFMQRAWIAAAEGDFLAAERFTDETCFLWEKIGHQHPTPAVAGPFVCGAMALYLQSSIYRGQGRLEKAIEWHELFLKRQRPGGTLPRRQILFAAKSALLHFEIGNLARAREALSALSPEERLEYTAAADVDAMLRLEDGRIEEARKIVEARATGGKKAGYWNIGIVLDDIRTEVLVASDNLSAAREVQEKRAPPQPSEMYRIISNAELLLEEGRAAEARALAEPAVARCEQVGALPLLVRGLAVVLRTYLAERRLAEARAVGDKLGPLAAASEHLPYGLAARIQLSRLASAAGDHAAAISQIESVRARADAKGYYLTALRARIAQAEIELAAGRNGGQGLQSLKDEAERRGYRLAARRLQELMRR